MSSRPLAPHVPPGRAPAAILEALAVAVMSADASDPGAVERLAALLDELAASGDGTAARAREVAAGIRVRRGDAAALASALDSASEAVAEMQEEVACRSVPGEPGPIASAEADTSPLELPEWGDERMLDEFVAAHRGYLDELEGAILEMESGHPGPRATFLGRLHTMKGEAGVLGLDDFAHVCHAAEDFLGAHGVSSEIADRLLKVRDWMSRALDAYARMRLPATRSFACRRRNEIK